MSEDTEKPDAIIRAMYDRVGPAALIGTRSVSVLYLCREHISYGSRDSEAASGEADGCRGLLKGYRRFLSRERF